MPWLSDPLGIIGPVITRLMIFSRFEAKYLVKISEISMEEDMSEDFWDIQIPAYIADTSHQLYAPLFFKIAFSSIL